MKKMMKKSLALMMVVMMIGNMMAMTVWGGTDVADIVITVKDSVGLKESDFTVYLIAEGTWDDDEATMTYKDLDIEYLKLIAEGLGTYSDVLESQFVDVIIRSQESVIITEFNQLKDASTKAEIFESMIKYAELGNNSELQELSITSGTGSFTIGDNLSGDNLKVGYYMVVTEEFPVMAGHTYPKESSNVLAFQFKADLPTMEKFIQHNEVNTNEEAGVDGLTDSWMEFADNQIGDTVYYKLAITLPTTVEAYTNGYVYILADAMDDGLTFNTGSVRFYNKEDSSDDMVWSADSSDIGLDLADYITILDENELGFILAVDVAKIAVQDDLNYSEFVEMWVYYDAVLNDKALIHDDHNVNTAALVYNKSTTDQYEGDDIVTSLETTFDDFITDDFNDRFNEDDDFYEDFLKDIITEELADEYGDLGSTGNPVYDYTFYVNLSKIDTDDVKHEGAVFEFFKMVEDGDGSYVREYFALEVIGEDWYITDMAEDNTASSIDMSAGSIVIYGLDDSVVYGLEETAAPSGLTEYPDSVFYFTIESTFDDNFPSKAPTLTIKEVEESGVAVTEKSSHVLWGDYAGDLESTASSADTMDITVINAKGSLLPSTGGMGTVIFQVVGAGMMIAAAAILVMKKRQS